MPTRTIGTTVSFAKPQIEDGLIRVPIAGPVGSARGRFLMRLKMSVMARKQTLAASEGRDPAARLLSASSGQSQGSLSQR